MPKNLDDLFFFAVDTTGLDVSKLTHAAGGLRDASGQLVRLARPVTADLLKQGSKARPGNSQAAAAMGIAAAGITVGFVVSENRVAIKRKAQETWRKVRGETRGLQADDERSFDPWHAERPDHSDGHAADPRRSRGSAEDGS